MGTRSCEKKQSNGDLQRKVAHHSPISTVPSLPQRRKFLHGSINDIGIAQGARSSTSTTVPIRARTRIMMVFRPMIDQLRAAQRDVVQRTEPTDRAPRSGARMLRADAPHDADVVSAHVEGGAAPVGQPARERVEQRERGDVLGGGSGGEVVRHVREPAEGGRAGGPVGGVDDQEQLVRGALLVLGDGEPGPAGVPEREERADDVFRVVRPREQAHLREYAARPSRGAAAAADAAGGLEPRPALGTDDRVEVFPEELPAEFAREVDVAGGKGVYHEEWVEVGVEEAVKGMASVSKLLHYRTSHVKGLG